LVMKSIKSIGTTPVEKYQGMFFKRDDLAMAGIPPGHPNGSKVRQYVHMIRRTGAEVPLVVGTAAAAAQQVYLASAGELFGRRAVVFVAARAKLTASTRYAIAHGADVRQVRPGHLNVVRARAKEFAIENGNGAVRWDAAWAVRDAAEQAVNIPKEATRVVVPVGSGLILLGVLRGLQAAGWEGEVLGVVVSKMSDEKKLKARWAKFCEGECPPFELYRHPTAYDEPCFDTMPNGVALDQAYAAKCMAGLRPGDCLWIPGIRPPEALDAPPTRPARNPARPATDTAMSKTQDDEMPKWQRGIPLARLKKFANKFKAHQGDHVYGAFALTKELAVAEAMDEKRLASVVEAGAVSLAIYRVLKSGSSHTDFAGRKIKIAAGSIILNAFVCDSPALGKTLLKRVKALAPEKPLWVEVFEEDPLAKAAVAQIPGLRYITTKVMAGSETKGLYTDAPGAEALHDAAEDAALCLVRGGFCGKDMLGKIRAEVAAADGFAQHYSNYNKGQTWTAYALRGYNYEDPTFIIKPSEMSRKWKKENASLLDAVSAPTKAVEQFPQTWRVVQRLEKLIGVADRVRLMRLDPEKGQLTRHADITDRAAGVRNGAISRLHIPINTNEGVVFQSWDKRGVVAEHHLGAGDLWYLDQRKPHAVKNTGTTERVHLVIDIASNKRLRAAIAAGT
jgi:hypothetical protein